MKKKKYKKLKEFKVRIKIDATYLADDRKECMGLIEKDFPNLEITDTVEVEEIKKEFKSKWVTKKRKNKIG